MPRKAQATFKTYECAFSACGQSFTRYVRPDRPELPERCCSKACMMRRRAELAGHFTTAAGQRYTPEQLRAKNYRRRTARRTYDLTQADERAMRAKAKRCPLCDVKYTDDPYLPNSKELDHIVPVVMGGTHTHGNCRIICRRCNQQRPKDGSDFAGQVTLWSSEPGVIPSAQAIPIRPCRCGAPRERDSGTHRLLARCAECRLDLEQRRQERFAERPVKRTIHCPYCDTTMVTGYARQRTCGSDACRLARMRDNWKTYVRPSQSKRRATTYQHTDHQETSHAEAVKKSTLTSD